MPQLKLQTIQKSTETEEQVFDRLRKKAEREKQNILSEDGFVRVFDSTPAMQRDGNRIICQWKYKQYPLT